MDADTLAEWSEVDFPVSPLTFVRALGCFPCFREFFPEDGSDGFTRVMDAWEQNLLSPSQAAVVELICHLERSEMPFDLRRSLQVWSAGDFAVFQALVSGLHRRKPENL